jgi:hypothetical protein
MTTPAFVYFERAHESDSVWRIAVRRGDNVIGHIFRVTKGYAYYPRRHDAVPRRHDTGEATLHETDLDRLKAAIEKRLR